MYTSAKPYFYGTGRRKKSVARVRLYPGTGAITINGKDIDQYFGLETLKLIINQPFGVTESMGKYDVVANVVGGGISGQAGAIRHGIARALLVADETTRGALKAAGLLTRDPRMKERKKYGLKAARRAPQFSRDNYYCLIFKRYTLCVPFVFLWSTPRSSSRLRHRRIVNCHRFDTLNSALSLLRAVSLVKNNIQLFSTLLPQFSKR